MSEFEYGDETISTFRWIKRLNGALGEYLESRRTKIREAVERRRKKSKTEEKSEDSVYSTENITDNSAGESALQKTDEGVGDLRKAISTLGVSSGSSDKAEEIITVHGGDLPRKDSFAFSVARPGANTEKRGIREISFDKTPEKQVKIERDFSQGEKTPTEHRKTKGRSRPAALYGQGSASVKSPLKEVERAKPAEAGAASFIPVLAQKSGNPFEAPKKENYLYKKALLNSGQSKPGSTTPPPSNPSAGVLSKGQWAETPRLKTNLQSQAGKDPKSIFGSVKPVRLEDVFGEGYKISPPKLNFKK
ncbi:MAG: uncharacterized protein A8A55_1563 [Amphiamblys sp. WSBS2006]|nr:MAG: uncharacterized protein A8A55_1563 [Amphiamblys sp. WSBS2006]